MARVPLRWNIIPKKSAFPAKAGTHFATAPSPDKWIPAFAGNADFRLVTPSRKAFGIRDAPPRRSELFVEPCLFEAPAVEDAVDHRGDPVHPRVPAGGEIVAPDDRAGGILDQLLVDLPDQLLALLLVRLYRLLLVHLFELGVAIVRVVALRAARIMLEEIGIRVVDPAAGQIAGDHEILAGDLGKPVRGLDDIELAVDIDLFQLVDEDDGGIAVLRDIAGRDLDLEPLIRPIAVLFHQLARFGPVGCDIRAITRQGLQ